MNVVLHEDPDAYADEYARVRAKLVSNSTSLNRWLIERGINRQLAYKALKGQSTGRKAIAIRRIILREILGGDD